jgi:hypothetical protein
MSTVFKKRLFTSKTFICRRYNILRKLPDKSNLTCKARRGAPANFPISTLRNNVADILEQEFSHDLSCFINLAVFVSKNGDKTAHLRDVSYGNRPSVFKIKNFMLIWNR